MKTQLLDSPSKRIPVAVAVGAGLILVAAVLYIFLGNAPLQPINGLKIIAAARTYTQTLRQRHAPVPHAVPLQTLIDQGLLQPADVGSLQGMDANIFLTARDGDPTVLMRVRMADGSDFVLLADGSTQELPKR